MTMEHDVVDVDGFVYSDPVAQRLDAIAAIAKCMDTVKDRKAKAVCLEAMSVAVATMRPKGQPATVSALKGGKAG
jgi:hypothetical protein